MRSRTISSQRQNSERRTEGLQHFTSEEKWPNGCSDMPRSVCDVQNVRPVNCFEQIGIPTRHSGQVCSGSDHFSQIDKLALTLAYGTYHSHAVTVNTFQKGRLHEVVNITNWRQL